MKTKHITLFLALIIGAGTMFADPIIVIQAIKEDVSEEITVAQALELGASLADNGITDKQYTITGYVSAINVKSSDTWHDQLKIQSFWVADSAYSTAKTNADGGFYVYRGKPETGAALDEGTKVQFTTTIKKYVGSSETIIENYDQNIAIKIAEVQERIWNIQTSAEPQYGTVTIQRIRLNSLSMTASPHNGYHFTQWSDGIIDNPRSIILTQDTIFVARFAKNIYSIITESSNIEWGTTTGDTTAFYLDEVQISATPNYGYHFVQWSDGNRDNPRTISITENRTYIATFAKNTYSITMQTNSEQGSITGVSQAKYLDEVTLTAIPNYGYHFTQWSDGDTQNPRTFEVRQDTSFTAEFAKNEYTIATESSKAEWGATAGDTTVLYLNSVTISATPNYGYHFTQWSDGDTQNPRTITVTENKTFQAVFAKNVYSITKITNSTQCSISGLSQAEFLDEVTLTAIPNYGYHFTQWSDGNTDNPRTIELTQDTTFTAEFAIDTTGVCGNDNFLTWNYDSISHTLAISGNGQLNSNYTFGIQAPVQTEKLIVEEGVTSIGNKAFVGLCPTITSLSLPSTVTTIGDSAFAGLNSRKFNTLVLPNAIISIGAHAFESASYLQTIHFGSVLEEIGELAFNGCTRVKQMTCLAEITPNVGTNGLSSISSLAELYIPNEYLLEYQIDNNWNRFVLKPIGATETTTTGNTVTVVADDNTATFTWPTNDNAASYSIQITKDGEVFCTLIFNGNGQLTGIAFAPGRNGSHQAPSATMANNAAQFTVTGLNSASKYGYRLAVTNESHQEIVAYRGEFATTGYIGEVNPGGEPEYNPEGIDEIESSSAPQKVMKNGQVFIIRGDKTYTVTGQEVR